MKLFLFTVCFSIISIYGMGQPANITLKVTNINNTKGDMTIALFNSADGFPEGDNYFIGKKIPVSSRDFKYVFSNIPLGKYAIAIYHDLDKNGELNTSWIGIPSEPYGFSYKKKGDSGSPDFDEALFELEGDKVIVIELID